MAKEIFELLAQYGLKKPADLDKVSRLTSKDASNLHEGLWEALFRLQYEGISPNRDTWPTRDAQAFRFVASRHLRGDSCIHCRVQKIEFLARFAALYSDLVVVPLLLDKPSRVVSLDAAKLKLRDAAESLILLRPLVRAGIVRPAVMTTRNCCRFHAENLEEFAELTHAVAEDIASDNLSRFAMYYEPPQEPGSNCMLHIEGPKDYLDHGGLVLYLSRPPSWVAKNWRREADGKLRVPPQKLRRSGIVQDIFERIANDTTFHFAYGSVWGAKYLTDLPGEAELLRGLGENGPSAQQHRAAVLISAMTHALPFVGDLAIPEILKIRSEISESFEQYRWAIAAIIQEHGTQRLKIKDAARICAGELAPKIAILENKVAVERRRFNNRVIATSSIVGVVVTLGLSGLMQPAVGCGLLGGALTALTGMLAESRSPLPEAATDNLYFLLRMKQAGKRGRSLGH
jgi:hypothetical protein